MADGMKDALVRLIVELVKDIRATSDDIEWLRWIECWHRSRLVPGRRPRGRRQRHEWSAIVEDGCPTICHCDTATVSTVLNGPNRLRSVHAETIATLIAAPVTKAKFSDREEIIDICREEWEEHRQFSFSQERLERKIDDILLKREGVIGIIRRSEIEAAMILQISRHWNSNDFCLEELLNFVRPRYRRSTNAKDMIQFAKRCSDELEIPLVIGVPSNEQTAAKVQLYERQLGKSCGGVFMYSKKPLYPQSASA